MPDLSLAIDAGQTGMKAALSDDVGAAGSYEFPGIRTDQALIPQLASVVQRVVDDTGQPVRTVAAGVSGLTTAETTPDELRAAAALSGVRQAFLAHDSVTAYLGALGEERGVVVAAGTGVVTLAVGRSAVQRVDGWGYLIGDAGSGYWIGRAAFDAVMRAYDGRGPQTALTDEVRREFPDLEGIYIELQRDPARVGRIAPYAKVVTSLAASDEVAAEICRSAGAELAASAIAGLTRVGEADRPDPVVCGIGGIFAAEPVAAAFHEAMRRRWPAVDLRPSESHALRGVSLLGRLRDDNPLRTLVAASAP